MVHYFHKFFSSDNFTFHLSFELAVQLTFGLIHFLRVGLLEMQR